MRVILEEAEPKHSGRQLVAIKSELEGFLDLFNTILDSEL
jgi:hypothetical protein